MLALVGGGLWWLSTHSLELGPGLHDRVTSELAPMLAAHDSKLDVGALSIRLRPGLTPSVTADALILTGPRGNRVELDRAELLLDRLALLEGRLAPRALRIAGMQVAVTRAPAGDVTFAVGDSPLLQGLETPGEVIAALEKVLAKPPLTDLTAVGATGISLQITDALSGSVLESANADLRLDREDGGLDLVVNLGEIGDRGAPGSARIELQAASDAREASLRVALRGIVPAKLEGLTALGAQADLLDRIDVPLSLDLEGDLAPDGGLGTLTGRVSAGSGELFLTEPLSTVQLTSATARIVTDNGGRRFDLTDLEIDTDVLALSGRGNLNSTQHGTDATGRRLTAQLDLRTVTINAGDRLSGIASFENVATDAEVTIDGADLNLDAYVDLVFNGDRLRARLRTIGPGGAGDPKRSFALDVSSKSVDRDSIFKLWPIETFPRTRLWLDENITTGRGHNMAFSLRFPADKAPPQVSLNFGYSDATIRFLDSIAPLKDAEGRATLEGKTFRLEIDKGSVTPEGAGAVNVRPSMMVVPDVTRRPGLLDLDLGMYGPTAAFLTVLSNPPFKTDPDAPDMLPPDQATGETEISTTIEIPLGKGGGMQAATFDIAGRVTDFTNDTLLEGKTLAAKLVTIDATQAHLEITSDATLNGQPLAISFTRDLAGAPDGATPPVITAAGPLTPALAEAVGVPVPSGIVSGAGQISTRIEMGDGTPPKLSVDADLAGLGVSLPQAGIRKSPSRAGRVTVAAELTQPPRINNFNVTMPGVAADGSATLAAGGGLARVSVTQLTLGNWLSARGSYRPATGGRAARLEIDGGRLDLRSRPKISGGTGGRPPDVVARLDRVTVSDELRLTGLSANLPGATGASGALSAKVNDIEPFTADLVRRRAGVAALLRTENAGALLAAANLFSRARGGRLELSMVPNGQPGTYDGHLQVTGGSLHGVGTAASIVSALSIVGAIEQMSGEGIVFSDAGARFTLAPGVLDLQSAYAEGPSLGLTVDGTVDLNNQQLALRGSVSPVYFLNRLGAPRRGEGLINVGFEVTGTTRAPSVRVAPGPRRTSDRSRENVSQPAARAN